MKYFMLSKNIAALATSYMMGHVSDATFEDFLRKCVNLIDGVEAHPLPQGKVSNGCVDKEADR